MFELLPRPEPEDRLNFDTTSQLLSDAIKSYSSCPILKDVKKILECQQVYQDGDREVSPDEISELQKIEAKVLKKKTDVEYDTDRFGKYLFKAKIILYGMTLMLILVSFLVDIAYGQSKPWWAKNIWYGTHGIVPWLPGFFIDINTCFEPIIIWLYSYIRRKFEKKEERKEKEPIEMKSSELVQRQLELVKMMEDVQNLKDEYSSWEDKELLLNYGSLLGLLPCIFIHCAINAKVV